MQRELQHNWFKNQTKGLVFEGTRVQDFWNVFLKLKSSDQTSFGLSTNGPNRFGPVQRTGPVWPNRFLQQQNNFDPVQRTSPVRLENSKAKKKGPSSAQSASKATKQPETFSSLQPPGKLKPINKKIIV